MISRAAAAVALTVPLTALFSGPGPATADRIGAAAGPVAQNRNSEQPPIGSTAVAGKEQALTAGLAVAAAPTTTGRGFWVAWSNGRVTTDGDAHFFGDMSSAPLAAPIVGIAPTPTGRGYWLLGADGGVFSFGDAGFHGSTGGIHLVSRALQMTSTTNGGGYDFVAGDGGVFSFGDARFYGSTGAMRLSRPVVGMASTPTGHGYWLVASDGGIFSFGDARFYGSTGRIHLNAPMVGMASTHNGNGYWLLAADGGVFGFGDAVFHGSGAGHTNGSSAIGIVATSDGGGYWIVLADGQVLAEGDATTMTGTASATSAPAGSYEFEVVGAGNQPIRWNPCEALSYAVVPSGAPAGWQNDVTNAIDQVSSATGIGFVNAGTFGSTSSVPSSVGVTIYWTPSLSGGSGDTIGLTNYWYYNVAGYTPQIISAGVELLTSLHGGDGPGGELPVLLHELGHAMGLAHTVDSEVMNPIDLNFSTYQAGDLAGLSAVGRGQGCVGFYR